MDDRSLWNAQTAGRTSRGSGDRVTISTRTDGNPPVSGKPTALEKAPATGTNPGIPPASLGWAARIWNATWNWVIYGDPNGPQPPPPDPPPTAVPAQPVTSSAKPSSTFGSDHVLG